MSEREIGIWLGVFSMGAGPLVTERLKVVSHVPPLVCLENKGTHLVYHSPEMSSLPSPSGKSPPLDGCR